MPNTAESLNPSAAQSQSRPNRTSSGHKMADTQWEKAQECRKHGFLPESRLSIAVADLSDQIHLPFVRLEYVDCIRQTVSHCNAITCCAACRGGKPTHRFRYTRRIAADRTPLALHGYHPSQWARAGGDFYGQMHQTTWTDQISGRLVP